MHKDVHKHLSNIIRNSAKLETTQMSTNSGKDKWSMVCSYDNILHSNKHGQSTRTYNKLDQYHVVLS